MAPSTPNGSSKTQQRPPLPYAHANPFLAMGDTGRAVAVKYQVITRDGQEMLVGRVKIHTPNNGHAFVLRRFDTGAISQTTMFRAAFPGAGDELEKQESAYIKANYDSPGANGGPGKESLRLAGNWVLPEVAIMLAPLYSLETSVRSLVQARPDPNSEYRRSTRPNTDATPARENTAPTPTPAPAPAPAPAATTSTATQPVHALVPDAPKPAKRRKEASPSPKKVTQQQETQSAAPRRSVRVTSPPPAAPSLRATRTRMPKTTPAKVTLKQPSPATGMLTPGADEEEEEDEEEVPDVPGPDMYQDIADQQMLIAKLKADRDALALASGNEEGAVAKRGHEEVEEQLRFNFHEPTEETALALRDIKTNKRLSLDLEPQQKSAAWGALWFATGLAVAATIPSFFV